LFRKLFGGFVAQSRVQVLGSDRHLPFTGRCQEAQNRTSRSAADLGVLW
jgi:hypothetical protein